jgi:hypothetical protein
VNRVDFMTHLAETIRPRSVQAGATILAKMLPFLTDLPDALFCEETLVSIAPKLPRSPTLPQLRHALTATLNASPASPPVSAQERLRQQQAEREAFLERDWDDANGIMQKVHNCDGNVDLLRLLARAVRRYAPQHLGYLPPHIIDAIDRDDQPHVNDNSRRL